MSVLTISELVLLNIRCLSTMNTIFAFNRQWESRYLEHQIEVHQLIRTGHDHFIDLLKCLNELDKLCIQNRFILDNIKMELTIAIESQSFDDVHILQLRTFSRQLKLNFEAFQIQLKRFGQDILIYAEDVQKEIKRIQKVPCSIKGTILNTVCTAVTMGCLVSDTMEEKNKDRLEVPLAISAGSISFTTTTAYQIMQQLKKKKMLGLIHVLNKVDIRMSTLFDTVEEFNHQIKTPMMYMDRHIELSEQNIAYYVHLNPNRVLHQAKWMLQNSVQLDTMFQDIQEKAKEHATLLRRAIRLQHPRSLLYL